MNIAKRALFTAILSAAIVTHSGTIAFKDGATLSEVEIVSIKDGEIKIRKDKKERTFKLNTISSFYSADTGSDSGEIPGDFADYKITIDDVKMPNKGEDTKGKDEKCVVSYIITRTDSKKDKIKVPYFYLYVLSSPAPDDSDGERGRYSYYYPDNAKPKGKSKGYDEAAINQKVKSFDRRIVDYSDIAAGRTVKNLGDREIKFELDKIGKRTIIAYHLEVWGNDAKVTEKDWKHSDHKIADRWWERGD
jgi:hypothetical protein